MFNNNHNHIALSNSARGNASPEESLVKRMLTEWRQELSAVDLTRLGIDYNFLYNRSVSVALSNFSPLAWAAIKTSDRDLLQPSDWKTSSRLKDISRAWLEDSLNLGRSLPVAFFIMAVELSHLAQTGMPSDSTTNMLRFAGLRSGVAGKLARYQQVDYSQIASAVDRIERILGKGIFPTTFKQDWEASSSISDKVIADLRRGLRSSGYDNQDIADIFERVKPGINGTAISRMLSGEALRNGVGPGILEVLANRSVDGIFNGLKGEFSLARESRMKKGRFDPHPSVLIRDVFGLPEECCAEFSSPTALTLESGTSYSLPLARSTVVEAVKKIEHILDRAIVNRQRREVFLESNSFFDVMRRADESMLITKGVLGKARMDQMLSGEFIPPLLQVREMLQLTGVPAFVEVKHRMLYGDHKAATLNAEQRFVDSLCEEQAETRNAYREAHETPRNPWAKSSFERFFRSMGEGSTDYDLHLKRVVHSFRHPGKVRGEILQEVCEAFIETRSTGTGYVGCVDAVCRKYPRTAAWFERTLSLAVPVLAVCGPQPERSMFGRLPEQLYNKLLSVTSSPGDSELALAWKAMRAVMRVLPGVSRAELVEIAGERSGYTGTEGRGAAWVSVKFNDVIWQALEASHHDILIRNQENRAQSSILLDEYLDGLFQNAQFSRGSEFPPAVEDEADDESNALSGENLSEIEDINTNARRRFDVERDGDFDHDFPLDPVIEIPEQSADVPGPSEDEPAPVEAIQSEPDRVEVLGSSSAEVLEVSPTEITVQDNLVTFGIPIRPTDTPSAPTSEAAPLSSEPFSRMNINSLPDARSRIREFMRRIESGESLFSEVEIDQ